MRMHIVVEDDLVARIDRVAGERGRSGWIVKTIKERIDTEERCAVLLAELGTFSATGHEWDDDPAAWVREQRSTDPARVG